MLPVRYGEIRKVFHFQWVFHIHISKLTVCPVQSAKKMSASYCELALNIALVDTKFLGALAC